MRIRRVAPLVVLLLCVGCSGDADTASVREDDPRPVQGADPDRYLIGGATCEIGEEAELIGMVDESGNLVPVEPGQTETAPIEEDEVDCYAFPSTDLTGPGTASLGDGFLTYADRSIPVDNMVSVDQNLARVDVTSHTLLHFVIHDGETRVASTSNSAGSRRLDYGAYGGNVVVTGDLYAADGGALDGRTFRFGTIEYGETTTVPDGDVLADGVFVFDADGDGMTEEGEFFVIADGQVTWTGTAPAVTLDMNLVLDDGSALTGHYEGDVLELDLFPDE